MRESQVYVKGGNMTKVIRLSHETVKALEATKKEFLSYYKKKGIEMIEPNQKDDIIIRLALKFIKKELEDRTEIETRACMFRSK